MSTHMSLRLAMAPPARSNFGSKKMTHILLAVSYVTALLIIAHTRHKSASLTNTKDIERMYIHAMTTVCILLWPVLWECFIGFHTLPTIPSLLLPLLLFPALTLAQLATVLEQAPECSDEMLAEHNNMMINGHLRQLFAVGVVCISTLYGVLHHNVDIENRSEVVRVLQLSLFIGLLLISPSLYVSPSAKHAAVLNAGQHVLFNLSVTLIVAGVVLCQRPLYRR